MYKSRILAALVTLMTIMSDFNKKRFRLQEDELGAYYTRQPNVTRTGRVLRFPVRYRLVPPSVIFYLMLFILVRG